MEFSSIAATGALSPSSAIYSTSSGARTADSLDRGMSLVCLPDELLSMCFCTLDASDLVALEGVSRRMRDLVTADDTVWRACAIEAWGKTQNIDLMAMAAESAGGWKPLFSEKKRVEAVNPSWSLPSPHEVSAIFKRTYNSIFPTVFHSLLRFGRGGFILGGRAFCKQAGHHYLMGRS